MDNLDSSVTIFYLFFYVSHLLEFINGEDTELNTYSIIVNDYRTYTVPTILTEGNKRSLYDATRGNSTVILFFPRHLHLIAFWHKLARVCEQRDHSLVVQLHTKR